ncbi:hypothetical protein ILYODFUR_025898 [Ilyodon furcidens]|uniref:Transposase n=1 Tax=Ilyodon furcidens TaxID=33524 RepID=A0ABV0UK82_9TELE
MPARSIITHIKTLLMCGVAYIREDETDAEALAQIPLGAISPPSPLLSGRTRTSQAKQIHCQQPKIQRPTGQAGTPDAMHSLTAFFPKSNSTSLPILLRYCQ